MTNKTEEFEQAMRIFEEKLLPEMKARWLEGNEKYGMINEHQPDKFALGLVHKAAGIASFTYKGTLTMEDIADGMNLLLMLELSVQQKW